MTQQHMERMTWLLRGQEGTRREKYREDLLEKALRVKNLDDLFNVLQKRKGWSRLIGREINPYFRNLGSINAASETLLQIKLPTDLDYLIF